MDVDKYLRSLRFVLMFVRFGSLELIPEKVAFPHFS